jgi:hypothetical protein
MVASLRPAPKPTPPPTTPPPPPGPIPASYGASSKLQHLHLRGHRLYGPLPELPPTIQLLDVSHNGLDGAFPSMASLGALDYLDVSNNKIGGSLPAGLAGAAPVRGPFGAGARPGTRPARGAPAGRLGRPAPLLN